MLTRAVGFMILVASFSWAGPDGRAGMEAGRESARVIADSIDVYDGPDDGAFVVGRLARGSRVVVRERQGGWVAIDPPAGAFCWVDARVLEDKPDGTAVVLDDGTVARSGVVGARMPGPPRLALARGMAVRPLDRRPLTLGDGPSRRVWRAIEPPAGIAFYIPAEGIDDPMAAPAGTTRRAALSTRGGPELVDLAPLAADSSLSAIAPPAEPRANDPALNARLGGIEAEHRRILRMPLDAWRLEPVHQRYSELLERTSDPASRAMLQARLQHVERQQEAAEAARRFRDVVTQSRTRDRQVHQLLAEAHSTSALPSSREEAYDGKGMLQRSSRLVDGVRVYALIGEEGHAIAYLKVPPGLGAEPLVSRQVGVRGTVGYDPGLRARIISAREIVPLGPSP